MKKIIFLSITLAVMLVRPTFAQHEPFHSSISVTQADSVITAHIDSDHPFIIIDLRTEGEYAGGFIEGAINYNYYGAGFDDTLAKLDKSKEYLIYCASGGRSGGAFSKMETLEFEMVYNMLGGANAWKAAGFSMVTGGTGINVLEHNPVVVQLYPNPITSESKFVLIDAAGQHVSVKVMNVSGQILDQFELIPGGQKQIDVSRFANGLYFFQVYHSGRIIQTSKFMKTD